MRSIKNVFFTIIMQLRVWLTGIWAVLQLLVIAVQLVFAKTGFWPGVASKFEQTANQRKILTLLRGFWPNLLLKRKFVQAYENNGTVIVTRRDDCLDVLNRDADFEVTYGDRMRKLTDGNNFFLGMQPGWDYTRDTSAMHLAMRHSDVATHIVPRAAELSRNIVSENNGEIDLPVDLTRHIPWDMTNTYFGTGGPDAKTMQEWTTTLFWYLFEDLNADPDFEIKAMQQAAEMRAYLDDAIKSRKAKPNDADDLLNRCLVLQTANTPGMDDLGIRNNLLGLLIGAIPTISKACCFAIDELLNRPEALRTAQNAALAGNDALLAQHIWEALRFRPHVPLIYRRATRDTVIAPATLRRVSVKKGNMVFATTLSAMFDPRSIQNANQFRTDRPWEDYIIWGYGMHKCFGAMINKMMIPMMLKPLLQQKNLRRGVKNNGQIDLNNTPHPQHFHLHFDR